MDYLGWNELLGQHFFNKKMAGREVILFADDALINALGEMYGIGVDDFIRAIEMGPPWALGPNLCEKAHSIVRVRKAIKSSIYPPYLGYLIFFVLAVDTEGDFSTNAYYPRLNARLGEPDRRTQPRGFEKMQNLWYDLQEWSIVDMGESLGRFIARVRGGWCHVGMPLSQTIITTEERNNLPLFFTENNFDPTLSPSIEVISSAMYSSGLFQKRTRAILQSADEEGLALRSALLELVRDELHEWDGAVSLKEKLGIKSSKALCITATLRICIDDYNPFLKKVKTSVRFMLKRPFPDDIFQLKQLSNGIIWSCNQCIPSWSDRLYASDNRMILEANILDWINGESFLDDDSGLMVRLRPSLIHIFTKGARERLPGWIESARIEPNTEHMMACHSSILRTVSEWGQEYCKEFKGLDANNLPHDWFIFKFANACKSHHNIDALQFTTSYSIRFDGGIKAEQTNMYFDFVPPRLIAEGANNDSSLYLNGKSLTRMEDGTWVLPEGVPCGVPLKVELLISGYVRAVRTITLTKPYKLREYEIPLYRGQYGEVLHENEHNLAISGIYIEGDSSGLIPPYPGDIPAYMAHRILQLGRSISEKEEWHIGSMSNDWVPLWAIAKIKEDTHKVLPTGKYEQSSKHVGYSNNLGKSKNVPTGRVVQPSGISRAKRLWGQYRKEAENI